MKSNGYTLMELVVVIGVLMVIVVSGMSVFYQSLRSGSKVDFEIFMNSSSRIIENSMTDVIGFSSVVSVEGQDQDACLAAGGVGVLGSSLMVVNEGVLTEYTLEDDFITSSSASVAVQINPEGMNVNILNFNWICVSGETEKLTVSFSAEAAKEGQVVDVSKDYSFDMLVKNSGYY
jgi:hypothetical protein